MRAKTANMVNIDTEIVRAAVKASGLDLRAFSLAVGKSPTYYTFAVNKGRIEMAALEKLAIILKRKPDEFIVEKVPKSEVVKVRSVSEPDAYDLLALIEQNGRRIKELEEKIDEGITVLFNLIYMTHSRPDEFNEIMCRFEQHMEEVGNDDI